VDHTRVVDIMRRAGQLPLVKDYLASVQKNNLLAVSSAAWDSEEGGSAKGSAKASVNESVGGEGRPTHSGSELGFEELQGRKGRRAALAAWPFCAASRVLWGRSREGSRSRGCAAPKPLLGVYVCVHARWLPGRAGAWEPSHDWRCSLPLLPASTHPHHLSLSPSPFRFLFLVSGPPLHPVCTSLI
jgi:hypothetical protein